MAYERTFTTIVPLEAGDDLEVARWLTRESFEIKAQNEYLIVDTYTEDTVAVEDLPPRVAKQMPKPLDAYTWHRFTALMRRDPSIVEAANA